VRAENAERSSSRAFIDGAPSDHAICRQFYDAVDGRRPNFSPAHIRLLARLDHDNTEAVADYLSRLPGGTPPPQTSAGGAVH
jgi:hypothetical protein